MITHTLSLSLSGQTVEGVQCRGLPRSAQHDLPCTHSQRGYVSKCMGLELFVNLNCPVSNLQMIIVCSWFRTHLSRSLPLSVPPSCLLPPTFLPPPSLSFLFPPFLPPPPLPLSLLPSLPPSSPLPLPPPLSALRQPPGCWHDHTTALHQAQAPQGRPHPSHPLCTHTSWRHISILCSGKDLQACFCEPISLNRWY